MAPCGDYPPDGKVTFSNITAHYDNVDVTNSIVWKTGYVEDVCNNRASVNSDGTEATITWNTAFPDPSPELIAESQRTGLHGAPRTPPMAAQA